MVRASFNLKETAHTHAINFNILGLFNQLFKIFETLDEFLTCIMSVVVNWGLCQRIHSELSKVVSSSCRYYPLWSLNLYLQRAGHTIIQLSWWFQKMQWFLQKLIKTFESAVEYVHAISLEARTKSKKGILILKSEFTLSYGSYIPEMQVKPRVQGK